MFTVTAIFWILRFMALLSADFDQVQMLYRATKCQATCDFYENQADQQTQKTILSDNEKMPITM